MISRQELYRNKYKKINHCWTDSISIFLDLIKKHTKPAMTVLDFGCGHNSLIKHIKISKSINLISADIDKQALKENKLASEKIFQTDTNKINLPNESVDLIICSWVFEHIGNPQEIFFEFFRILKRKGKIVFLTPNRNNPIVIFYRLFPMKVRIFLARTIEGQHKRKIYKIYYKLNSEKQIQKYANDKFDLKLIFNGDPSYIALNSLCFWFGVFWEKIINLPVLEKTKIHLIGIFTKKSDRI